MRTYIALLRGINVSGKNKIIMADFRIQLEQLDFQNIRTYIQSGNILFDYKNEDFNIISDNIRKLISSIYKYDVPCIVFDHNKIKEVVGNNPFLSFDSDLKFLHVSIPSSPIDNSLINKIEVDSKNDRYIILKNIIYLYTPGGYGKTKLNNTFLERKLKQSITTRNWKTSLKLLELSSIE